MSQEDRFPLHLSPAGDDMAGHRGDVQRPPASLPDAQSDDGDVEPASDFVVVDAAGDALPPSEPAGGVVDPVGFVLEEVDRESVE